MNTMEQRVLEVRGLADLGLVAKAAPRRLLDGYAASLLSRPERLADRVRLEHRTSERYERGVREPARVLLALLDAPGVADVLPAAVSADYRRRAAALLEAP